MKTAAAMKASEASAMGSAKAVPMEAPEAATVIFAKALPVETSAMGFAEAMSLEAPGAAVRFPKAVPMKASATGFAEALSLQASEPSAVRFAERTLRCNKRPPRRTEGSPESFGRPVEISARCYTEVSALFPKPSACCAG
jgi:hypothetical protein